mgnify:CR=1 FL=1
MARFLGQALYRWTRRYDQKVQPTKTTRAAQEWISNEPILSRVHGEAPHSSITTLLEIRLTSPSLLRPIFNIWFSAGFVFSEIHLQGEYKWTSETLLCSRIVCNEVSRSLIYSGLIWKLSTYNVSACKFQNFFYRFWALYPERRAHLAIAVGTCPLAYLGGALDHFCMGFVGTQ